MEYTLEIVNLEPLCRICLSEKKEMYALNSPLHEMENISIKDLLETVMSEQVILAENLPLRVCEICLVQLKKMFKLRDQFLNSTKVLQNLFGNLKKSAVETASVEVIFGENKFNLNDLVIVENSQDEKGNFNGFLNNLGKTVSVSFANKYKTKVMDKKEELTVTKDQALEIPRSDSDTDGDINSVDNIEYFFKKGHRTENVKCVSDSDVDSDKFRNINVDAFIKEEGNEDKYIVSLADDYSTSDTMFMDQDLLESALNKRYECKTCHKVYSIKTRYKSHILSCMEYAGKDSTGFSCKSCTKTFKTLRCLKLHIKETHNIMQLKCKHCDKTFSNKKRYNHHKKHQHSDISGICDFCGKKFINKHALKEHRLRHTAGDDIVQCICPICGKTFNYTGGLFYHMKMHNNERNYKCSYCERRFYTKMSLVRHEKTHTGIRPFECFTCKKRFFSRGELRKHQFTHTGTSPYQCKFCNKYFCSKFNLEIHLTFYKGEHMCEICNRGFIDKDILRFHINRKHRNKKIENKDKDDALILEVDDQMFEPEFQEVDVKIEELYGDNLNLDDEGNLIYEYDDKIIGQ